MLNKKDLRIHVRRMKQLYSEKSLIEQSESIIKKLESNSCFQSAHVVLMYYSLPDEVFTHDLINKITVSKIVLLPEVIDDKNIQLRQYTGPKDLKYGAFHILEPTGNIFTEYNKIDVAIIPGIAFDTKFNRLGRGKGYYDRFLKKIPEAFKIGVCFEFQKFDKIPSNKNDVIMNIVI